MTKNIFTCVMVAKEIVFGSVYFTTKMLAATDWVELLCCQSSIWSHGMMQFE